MAAKPRQDATYADLEKLPENMVGEILDGELIATPRPASPHALATSRLMTDLGGPFDRESGGSGGPGGWWILAEPELHLKRNVIVPDLGGWRHERMPRLPNVAAFDLAPDWVCEVVSTSTRRYDRGRKRRIYAREGVSWMWLVEPLDHLLEVHRLENGRWVEHATFEGDDKVRAEPFDAVELDLTRYWLPDEPSP